MDQVQYRLQGKVAPVLRLAFALLTAATALALLTGVPLVLTGTEGGLLALGLALLLGPLALVLVITIWRVRQVRLDLALDDDGMSLASATDTRRLRWANIVKVDVSGAVAVFRTRDGDDLALTYPGAAQDGRWLEMQEAMASRLDADRGYEHRLCESHGPGERPDSGCHNPLGCAGQDTCELHALKQTRA